MMVDLNLRSLETEDAAEAALARFRAEWPIERTRDMAASFCGTPAEQEAAAMRIGARRAKAETPADAAVLDLLQLDQGLRKYSREMGRA